MRIDGARLKIVTKPSVCIIREVISGPSPKSKERPAAKALRSARNMIENTTNFIKLFFFMCFILDFYGFN